MILCALPLALGYGLYHVLMGFWVGATVVIEQSFAFPVKVLETAARERVTVFPGVPTMFAPLVAFEGLAQVRPSLAADPDQRRRGAAEERIRRRAAPVSAGAVLLDVRP